MSADVYEPVCVPNARCDGVAAIHVDQAGIAHVNLYAGHLECDGGMARVLVARLTMSREVMRKIADRMMTETMVASHHSERAEAELRRRMI